MPLQKVRPGTVHRLRPDISVLADSLEVPGIGHIPVNAFVLLGAEPVVVDTGLGLPDRNFVEVLATVLDPADVRWICERLQKLTDQQWRDAFRAAAYEPSVADRYIAKLKARVQEGLALR